MSVLIVSSLADTLTTLFRAGDALRKAAVPLAFGIISAAVAGIAFVLFGLSGEQLAAFFSSAAQVGIGILIALILERVTASNDEVARGIRAGTVVLAAVGTGAALVGTLTTNDVVGGVAFAFTWWGLAAGVLGLFVFVADVRLRTVDEIR